MKKNSLSFLSQTQIYSLLVLFLWVNLYSAQAISAEREYVVPMADSKWESGGKEQYECTLSQMIPFYGEGKFIRKSGHNVAFQLFSDDAVLKDDARIVLQSEPPSWRHDDKVFEIGQFNFEHGHNPLDIKTHHASRMFQQVENGMSPVIIYRDLADGRDMIAVMLSPINFRAALKDYRECEQTLLDFDIDEIKNLKLYFATNKDILTPRSKRDLKNVLRYLEIDPAIKQIKVDAHADSRGRRRFNDKLSERRSAAVVKYLLSVGAKKEMIYSVAHGERVPSFDNKTATGRAKNRRADVQLLTEPPPTPEEQEALEQARIEERRRQLTERSIFKDLARKKTNSMEEQDSSDDETEKESMDDESAQDEPPYYASEEPPVPNFINFDHLVDKNNQKIPSK